MSGPYSIKDAFENSTKPILCPDPENCEEIHNEIDLDEEHHYGCECGDCMYYYWRMKN